MCAPLQEPQTASKLTTMLLAMADVRAVLVALAARLARLRSAAALAGERSSRAVCEKLLKTCARAGVLQNTCSRQLLWTASHAVTRFRALLHLQRLRPETTMGILWLRYFTLFGALSPRV